MCGRHGWTSVVSKAPGVRWVRPWSGVGCAAAGPTIIRTALVALIALLAFFGTSTTVEAQPYNFQVIAPMASYPAGSPAFPRVFITKGADGNFYGTTGGGGSNNTGTLFK